MRNVTILLAIVAMLALAAPAYAADSDWSGLSATDPTDFHDDDNWIGSAPPPAWTGSSWYADVGEVTGGTLAIISSDVDLRDLRVGGHIYDAVGAAEVRMATGTYTVAVQKSDGTGRLCIGVWGDSSELGTFTQYGGDLTVGHYSSSLPEISLDIGGGGYGEYTIYGGSIDADWLYLGRYSSNTTGTGEFTVVGSGASAIGADAYTQSDNSTLTFDINGYGTTGITKIVVSGDVAFDGDLVITKVGALTGTHYVLMTYSSRNGTAFDNIDVSGVPGWSVEYDQGGGGNELWLVPEPATLALLGIGGIGVLLRRRKK